MGKGYYCYWGSANKSSKKAAAPQKSDQPYPSPGCISSVFQLFDFHHFHFPNFQHQPTCSGTNVSLLPHHQPSRSKGGEAPRTSLESLQSTIKEEENLKIPGMGMRVKTRTKARSKGVEALNISNFDSCSESEINNSPGAKTPNLVARLMGLDVLPDNNSASPSASCRAKPRLDPRKLTRNQTTRNRNSVDGGNIAGIRSLPETPRISSARRSDGDNHHRLSLQLNKENYLSINEDENRSPVLYVKQRVKQIKESFGRTLGIDITNTVKSRGQHQGKDEFKSQKISKKSAREEPAVLSSSLRVRVLEPKNRTAHKGHNNSEGTNPQNLRSFKDSSRLAKKFKSDSSNTAAKFDIRHRKPQQATDIIRNKQEEPFVRSPSGNRVDAYDRKCKRTPLSPFLLNVYIPNLPHVKKDPCPPEKQPSEAQKAKPNRGSSPLSCSSSQGYKEEEATHAHATQDGNRRYGGGSSAFATVDESAELEYVTNLLRLSGIDGNTGFPPSRPLVPYIFYCIEDLCPAMKTTNPGKMGHRCNRKLVFDLVDVILKPYHNKKPWGSSTRPGLDGTELVEALVSKLRSFPQADCRVLEDIDALVEIDLRAEKAKNSMALEEEGEGIVTAVGEEILERLIEETATEICRPSRRYRFDGESHGSSQDYHYCYDLIL